MLGSCGLVDSGASLSYRICEVDRIRFVFAPESPKFAAPPAVQTDDLLVKGTSLEFLKAEFYSALGYLGVCTDSKTHPLEDIVNNNQH